MLGRWRGAALALIAMGAALRLWSVPLARFTGDESSFWDTARAITALERFPALGPEITGAPAHLPGPLFHYLTALPQLLGVSPYWGGGFMAALHVAAGLLLARFAGDARGPRAGLIALALWALAPWDILYGDRIWASCLAPVLGTVAMYAAHRAVDHSGWLAVAIATCGVLPQVHLSAPLVWTAVLVYLAARWRPRPGWAVAVGAGVAITLIAYLPFFVVELDSGFANTQAILAHSGGAETGLGVLLVPVKVFGYAIAYASGEISYQFARGYWGGGFDELRAFGTVDGLTDWWSRHGPTLGVMVGFSVLLAATAWGVHLVHLVRSTFTAFRARERVSADVAMGLAVLAGLAVGAALMMSARKTFFPHYANVLMPFALWPAVSGLDHLMGRAGRVGRRAWTLGLGVAVLGMGANTVRYYREVETLNGLRTTKALVSRVLAEPGPVALSFTHFRNTYAWRKLASGYYGQTLELDPEAPLRFVVHNQARAKAEAPGERVGPVTLERVDRASHPAPADAELVAFRDWKRAEVTVRGAPGLRGCRPEPRRCAYGPHPWQRFQPEYLRFAGRLEPVMFMHPVANATVSARFFAPPTSDRAVLRFGLTDDALRSSNRTPVQVVLRTESEELLRARTSPTPGLTQREIQLGGRTEDLFLDIWTNNDGARVFGFDLWLLPPEER